MAKERKKTIDEINIINNIKIYVNKYSDKTNFVKSVDFEEQSILRNSLMKTAFALLQRLIVVRSGKESSIIPKWSLKSIL